MEFISNKDQMALAVKDVIDLNKMPLGKLTEESIQQGYRYLRELEKALTKNDSNNASFNNVLLDLSGKFFSYIPHNFGF